MSENLKYEALLWRSRRGLLELELLLAPFLRTRLHALDDVEKARYARLLEFDDCDLYDWIQGRSEPDDPEFVRLISDIRAANVPGA